MVEKVPAIYRALQKVMAGVANIPKNGVMSFGSTSYNYLKADDVQDALNPLLVASNIILSTKYAVTTGVRGNRDWVYVDLKLTYISTEDGSELTNRAVGESIGGDDKSVNKALTQAIKNSHRTMFQFASGEPDPDDPTTKQAAPKTSPAAKKVERAKKASANKPGKNQAKIVSDWIDSEKVTREDVNTLYGRVKTEKPELKGDAIFGEVLAHLEKGEVG